MTASSLLIVGTGALACFFAARLSAAGAAVTMLGTWPAGLQALRSSGVRLIETDGQEKAYPVIVRQQAGRISGVSQALVLVKSWQTGRAARQLATCLSPAGVALTLQNGLGNREILAAELGEQRVAVGSTTSGAYLLGPGRVRAGGEGVITLGPHPRLGRLRGLLRAAGFVVENTADLQALLWGKVLVNAAINPLTALLEVPNGSLLEISAARSLLVDAAFETAAVARAQGIVLPYPDPVAMAETVARRTAANHSSMLQDILRGSPTEIDAICGAIVRMGEALGIPTPVNRVLWHLVHAKEEKNREHK